MDRQKKAAGVLSKEQPFSKDQQLNLSLPERFHLGLARAKATQMIVREEDWDHENRRMAEFLNDEMSTYHLHMTMYGKCFK